MQFTSFNVDVVQVTTALEITDQNYNFNFGSNIGTYGQSYSLKYTSINTSLITTPYTINFTSTTKDTIQGYSIKFVANVVPTTNTQTYKLTYNSLYGVTTNLTYNLAFTSEGLTTQNNRTIYRLRYSSEPISVVSTTYKMKYLSQTTDLNSTNYTLAFNSYSIPSVRLIPVLLRNTENKSDIVFGIYATSEIDFADTLMVLSNMPKYQLVEYKTSVTLPYVIYYPKEDIYDLGLELDGRSIAEPLYYCQGYIVLKDVNEDNPVSMDMYSISNGYIQLNTKRSFFFDLSSTAFEDLSGVAIDSDDYLSKNQISDYFNSDYLNYAVTELTPMFKLSDSCCFSQVIAPSSSRTVCSPF